MKSKSQLQTLKIIYIYAKVALIYKAHQGCRFGSYHYKSDQSKKRCYIPLPIFSMLGSGRYIGAIKEIRNRKTM